MSIPVRVGVIGCGRISSRYFRQLSLYENVEVVACADLDYERARTSAELFGIHNAYGVDDLLGDDDVGLVLNLTVPQAHTEVSLAAINAGKHIYSEKPLGIDRADGAAIVQAAADRTVMAACAPDTFLGAGIQTSRKLLDAGIIGEPFAAAAYFVESGHEHSHPSPGFFYLRGGGPVLDMGPYYLTALVVLLGPIARVSSFAKRTYEVRTSCNHPGLSFPVEVPTHVVGALQFRGGATASTMMSFDVWASETPRIEIYGTEGTISVPDPNTFNGPVRVKIGNGVWKEVPMEFAEGGRGLGVAEMAYAIQHGIPSRIDASLANHILDAMVALHESSDLATHVDLKTTCARPEPLPIGLLEGQVF